MQEIEIPIKVTAEDGTSTCRWEKWPFLDPHLVVNFLYNSCGLHISQTDVREYWMRSKSTGAPWATQMPDLGPNDKGFIPLGLYGDSARVKTAVGQENVAAWFFNLVLWRPRSIRASRFLVFAIPEEKLHQHWTMLRIMARITWSMNLLWDGLFPSTGPFGEVLSPRLQRLANTPITWGHDRFQVSEIRGDWAWLKKIFRFYHCSWNGVMMCHFCGALSQSSDWSKLYWNFTSNTWQQSKFDLVQFLSQRMPPSGICTWSKWVRFFFFVQNTC